MKCFFKENMWRNDNKKMVLWKVFLVSPKFFSFFFRKTTGGMGVNLIPPSGHRVKRCANETDKIKKKLAEKEFSTLH